MTADQASDFLLGGGGKSVAFDNVGDSVTGTIESTEVRQQTDIQHGTPLTWDNGDPKMQLVVTLQTALRDPAIDNDDGKRNVYIKGSKKAGTRSTHDAVASAVRAAGADGLKVGGTLTLQYVASEPSATRGFSDRKLWAAQYVPPSDQSGGFLGTQPQAVTPGGAGNNPNVASVEPVQQPAVSVGLAANGVGAPVAAAPAAGPQDTPEARAALVAAGIDPATVFGS